MEPGFCGFAVGDDGFDVVEAGFFEHGGEVGLGEAEPAVGVELAGFLEVVLEEIEDDEAAAGFENAEGGVEGALGVFRVVEGLAEDGEVEGAGVDGGLLDIADAVFEVGEAVAVGEVLAELDHFRGEIDGDDFFGALGEELGEGALAGAEVGDDLVVEDLDEGLGEGFPGAAGDVILAKAAGEFIEIGAGGVPALAEEVLEGGGVRSDFRDLGSGEAGDLHEVGGGGGGVDVVLAAALVGDEFLHFQLGELGGDAALAHSQNLLEFSHRERFLGQQHEDAEAGGV